MNTISYRELEPFFQKLCKRLQCPGEKSYALGGNRMNTTPDEIWANGPNASEKGLVVSKFVLWRFSLLTKSRFSTCTRTRSVGFA